MQPEILEKTIEVRDQLGVKQGRRSAEDLVDDAEYRVKQHPFSALGVSFGIGMGLGAAIGVLLARNGRNGR